MQWYYEQDGAQQGPVEEDELRAMLHARTVTGATLVWREGMENWEPAGQIPEWAELMPAPAHAAVPGYAPPVYGPPATSTAGVVPTNGLAIASMVCGIMSLVLLFSCGIGAIAGIPAVICGHMALTQIKAGPVVAGRGMAIAGLVTGYLSILITMAFLAFIGIAIAIDGTSK